MPNRRTLSGALQNFLGTFTSRHSDFGGYWLFGFLTNELVGLQIDLLASSPKNPVSDPMVAALALARMKFREQVQKAGLRFDFIREANLSVTRIAQLRCGETQRHREGYNYAFVASAISDRGAAFEARSVVFVAPHNSDLEQCSSRFSG